MSERYTIEEFTREISVEEYLDRFHNPAEVWGYCRECSNYGKQWGCPPFDFDVAKTVRELFEIELKWSTNGSLPEYLVLVCGLFYNAKR